METITHSAKETMRFGKKIAKNLKGGDVVCLYGDLGAGKTTLIKGIAKGFGISQPITSPTFVLMKRYPLPAVSHWSRVASHELQSIIHIDCYRVHSPHEIADLGFSELLKNKKVVILIEWADRIKKILPKRRIEIFLQSENVNSRKIRVKGLRRSRI